MNECKVDAECTCTCDPCVNAQCDYWKGQVTELIEHMKDAKPHLKAGHSVVMHWNAAVTGHVKWNPLKLVENTEDGWAEVYQTEIMEDGPTEQANCNDCDILLDIDSLTELGV